MTISDLSTYTRISPNTSGIRGNAVTKVTVHHMAGNCSVETCGEIFANPSRQASSNYGIGSDGRIGCYLEEEYHPWTSSSYWNDDRAITIEVADYDCENWVPSDAAYESTVLLCADICNRYGITPTYTGGTDGSFTEHMMFASTSCPGPWWHAHMNEFIEDVKAAMEGEYMALTEQDMRTIARYVAEYTYPGDPIMEKTGHAGNDANRYNVLNIALYEIHDANEKLDALAKKVDSISVSGVDVQAVAKAVNDEQAKRMRE